MARTMTTCPVCGVAVREDRVEKHLQTVHQQKSFSRPAPVLKAPPGKRICPFCKSYVPINNWMSHARGCKQEQAAKARPEPLKTQGQHLYVTDEFGIVHTYDKWYENQHMGEGRRETPVEVERYPGPKIVFSRQKSKPRKRKASSPAARSPAQVQAGKSKKLSHQIGHRKLVPCPKCNARVWDYALEKHIENFHSESQGKSRSERARQSTSLSKLGEKGKPAYGPARPHGKSTGINKSHASGQEAHTVESLRQSFDEPRDGSKYQGHFRRESSGQFGSFPLHDDYDDEADAN